MTPSLAVPAVFVLWTRPQANRAQGGVPDLSLGTQGEDFHHHLTTSTGGYVRLGGQPDVKQVPVISLYYPLCDARLVWAGPSCRARGAGSRVEACVPLQPGL